ncbi:uncharacterized protein LOC121988772 isoform X4 [Zingiber officinale]|uniref:uncharacterized protein LOC121988772 isoform X4 n=1 Tax=Zingiber officinale TaxID=94328 RepID=UPI001C4D6936|nr:uncharacterized protein LOC121988772 isoform X4 [Zingiber officinale]
MKIYLFCEELHSVGSVHTEQLRKQIKLMSEMGAASGQIRSMKLQDCSRMQRLKHMMRSCTSFWWLRSQYNFLLPKLVSENLSSKGN